MTASLYRSSRINYRLITLISGHQKTQVLFCAHKVTCQYRQDVSGYFKEKTIDFLSKLEKRPMSPKQEVFKDFGPFGKDIT